MFDCQRVTKTMTAVAPNSSVMSNSSNKIKTKNCDKLLQNWQRQSASQPRANLCFTCVSDGECMTEFRTRLNRGQTIGASLPQHTDFNKDTTNESASMACSNARQ